MTFYWGTCKQCGSSLAEKRPDAKYCDSLCRQKHYLRRKKFINEKDRLKRQIESDKNQAKRLLKKIYQGIIDLSDCIDQLSKQIKKKKSKLKFLKFILGNNFYEFVENYRKRVGDYPEKYPSSYNTYLYASDYDLQLHLENIHSRMKADIPVLLHQMDELYKKSEKLKKDLERAQIDEAKVLITIEEEKNTHRDYEDRVKDIDSMDLDNLEPQPHTARRKSTGLNRKNRVRVYSSREILKMKFDVLNIPSELGKFLGGLQREKCAIALTGDSGAGKTTFSFQIAKAFTRVNLSVGYFSLESGITQKARELLSKLNFADGLLNYFANGDVEDVKSAASKYDCVIVDSYSKISTKPETFEELRQEFPNTFFVIIFQKTTDGKIRGGSSITYNSTAAIDIRISKNNQRYAVMTKSRYETQNFIYSISQNKLLKDNDHPIDWVAFLQNTEKHPSNHGKH